MREITIDQRDGMSPTRVHAALKSALGFPDYYGGNFAALSDCLGDVSEPTRIEMLVDQHTGSKSDWYRRLARVLERAASENPAIEVNVQIV